MKTLLRLAAVFLLWTPIAAWPAMGRTELIEVGASQNHFYIEPSFSGSMLSLFGSIDREQLKDRPFDVAVTIQGPERPVTVWKKERRFGVWMNTRSVTFDRVPNYYTVLSTKPVAELAPLSERKQYEIGLDALRLPLEAADHGQIAPASLDEFQKAVIRLKTGNHLYSEKPSDIDFIGSRLFRSRVFLPATAGPGLYRANFFVLQGGKVAGSAQTHVRLKKIGIEAELSSAAIHYPILYGVIAVMLAAAVGGGASLMFRRS
jgi:uncharacterized protein (TIGR02186 family)